MNVYTKMQKKKTEGKENKIGLVSQKYYTNQKSIAHLSFEVKIIFEFIENLDRVWSVGFLWTGT